MKIKCILWTCVSCSFNSTKKIGRRNCCACSCLQTQAMSNPQIWHSGVESLLFALCMKNNSGGWWLPFNFVGNCVSPSVLNSLLHCIMLFSLTKLMLMSSLADTTESVAMPETLNPPASKVPPQKWPSCHVEVCPLVSFTGLAVADGASCFKDIWEGVQQWSMPQQWDRMSDCEQRRCWCVTVEWCVTVCHHLFCREKGNMMDSCRIVGKSIHFRLSHWTPKWFAPNALLQAKKKLLKRGEIFELDQTG